MVSMKRSRPQQQTCKSCGQPDKFDFCVPDDIWEAIVPPNLQNRVVCLYCFDDYAREQGVDYADSLRTMYFAGRKAAFKFRVVKGVSVT